MSGSGQKENNERTQIERATSWSRAFTNLYQEIKWLNAFAKINKIAVKQALDKLPKTMLETSDNVIEKKLLVLTKQRSFYAAEAVVELNN